jgi:hypothetical protein
MELQAVVALLLDTIYLLGRRRLPTLVHCLANLLVLMFLFPLAVDGYESIGFTCDSSTPFDADCDIWIKTLTVLACIWIACLIIFT